MKQKISVKKGGKGRKREWMIGAGLLAYLIGLVIRIPLSHMIGDQGIGFYSIGMEIYMLASAVLSYGIAKAVAILIKYRVKREMFKSARKVYKNALFLTTLTGVLLTVGVFFLSETIATTFILEQMGYLAIAAAAPAILLAAVMGVLKGYFQGMGTMLPTVHSKLVVQFIMLAASLIFGSVMYKYGVKVAALLKNNEYAAAYGALGAIIGLSVACLFGVLHLVFINVVYAGTFKQQLMRDGAKYAESNGQIISMLLSTALPYMLCALLYNMNYLVDQRIYNYASNIGGRSGTRAAYWGVYYGKYSPVIGIAAILCTFAAVVGIPKIVQMHERKERREVQLHLENSVHYIAIISIPTAVLTAALAEPIVGILFSGETKTAITLIQAGSSVIVLFAFSYFFMGILQRIRKMRMVMLGGLIAFILHLGILYLLSMKTNLGITAVVCGMIVFWLTVCVTGFIGVIKYMQYSQEWIRTFGITVIAAGAAGLIILLLCKALLGLVGNIIMLVLGLPIGILVYNVLLILLRGVREEELEDMPGGKVIIFFAEKVHLL